MGEVIQVGRCSNSLLSKEQYGGTTHIGSGIYRLIRRRCVKGGRRERTINKKMAPITSAPYQPLLNVME